jgi:hypothetical protein
MMNVNDNKIGLQYMGNAGYYNDSLVVTMKGLSMELTRILTTFTTIDLSNNMFEGEIPQLIGDLSSLKRSQPFKEWNHKYHSTIFE